ncbi:MAG: PAS domain-containing protein, partial [Myxococcaceae bacterium]|nr:PAS domain-containing protein [Myxococcaceae bacterium]
GRVPHPEPGNVPLRRRSAGFARPGPSLSAPRWPAFLGMILVDLLEQQQDAIVERWLEQVRPLAPRPDLTRVELVGTLPALLTELARALRQSSAFPAPPACSHVAEEHGKQRRRLGYATGAVAREYPLLQDAILQMAQARGVEVRTTEGLLMARCMGAASEAALAHSEEQPGLARQAKERIGESEERLRLVVDSLPSLIAYIDADQRYVLGNAAYCTWYGVAPGTLHGRTVREVVGEENYARIRPYIERVLAGEVVHYSEPFLFAGGRHGHAEATLVPHRGPDGRMLGYVVLVQDVTERKVLEAELRRASDSLEHGDPMYILDRDFRYVLVNQGMERLTGKPRQELLGRVLWEVFPTSPQPDSLVGREFHRARDERVPVQFESFSETMGRWMETTVYPTPEGGIAVFHRDISERKRLEAELRRAFDALEHGDPMYILDREF